MDIGIYKYINVKRIVISMSFFIEVGTCDFDTCEQLIKNG